MATYPRFTPSRRHATRPDHIGLVGYHEVAFVLVPPTTPHSPQLQQQVQTLDRRVGGLTNIASAIRTSTAVLKRAPWGVLRRLWLLSDGEPNRQVAEISDAVADARSAYVNINCIGFGDVFDERLLRGISSATHNGRFVSVQSIQQLVNALASNCTTQSRRSHRTETTVIAIDLSASMREPMGGRTKIAVVQTAILQLLFRKQQLFA